MTLLLDQLLNQQNGMYKSGRITLYLPDVEGLGQYSKLHGILSEEISLSLGTKWGTILPDMAELSQLSQFVGSQNIISWVAASNSAWRSTEPLKVDVDFYLVSYKPQSPNIKQQVSNLLKLSAMHVADTSGIVSGTTVKVHGGYKIDVGTPNNRIQASDVFFDNNTLQDNIKKQLMSSNKIQGGTSLSSSGKIKGLIRIDIGDQLSIENLLLQNVTPVYSSVQVEPNIPLYIRVTASFITYRALLTSDIDEMHLGGNI